MKKYLILILALMILTACGQDLPPTPAPPGQTISVGGAIAGLASGMPTWSAPPQNVDVTPSDVKFGEGVIVTASDYDYVYKNGYYFDSQRRMWRQFALQGEQVENWIKNRGVATVHISETYFKAGENYLVVYACNRANGWQCNDNKWMLLKFTVLAPEKPNITLPNIDEYVINAPVNGFEIMGTDAEMDNFESIIVKRYDARYKDASQGLVVITHVFEFDNMQELKQTTSTLFRDIINQGWKRHNGQNLAIFLDEYDQRVAVWTSGKKLIYVETHEPQYASKEIIEAYQAKYASDLQKQ